MPSQQADNSTIGYHASGGETAVSLGQWEQSLTISLFDRPALKKAELQCERVPIYTLFHDLLTIRHTDIVPYGPWAMVFSIACTNRSLISDRKDCCPPQELQLFSGAALWEEVLQRLEQNHMVLQQLFPVV